jgi:hypothetical protein
LPEAARAPGHAGGVERLREGWRLRRRGGGQGKRGKRAEKRISHSSGSMRWHPHRKNNPHFLRFPRISLQVSSSLLFRSLRKPSQAFVGAKRQMRSIHFLAGQAFGILENKHDKIASAWQKVEFPCSVTKPLVTAGRPHSAPPLAMKSRSRGK